MQITINIPNEQLFEKILWLLSRFKNDGVEIITNIQKNRTTDKNPQLKQFKQIINTKSKDSVKVSEDRILNPHSELSHNTEREPELFKRKKFLLNFVGKFGESEILSHQAIKASKYE